jgi:hypothetical protein
MPDPGRNLAAAWLIAEYDATDPADLGVYDEDADVYRRPASLQPMFQLKTDNEPGATMHVTARDYHDDSRWWL